MTTRALHSTLPPLAREQARHSQRVAAAVRAAVLRAGGWLSFSEYLQIALYAPGLGYYSAGTAKFGRDGDFITAPELSPLFGRCLARQCGQILRTIAGTATPGDGACGDILELGAGSGRLAFEMLTTMAAQDVAPQRYLILEVSADLRARQRALLATLPAPLRTRVQWLDALPTKPIRGVILANEVADALPFERFVVGSGGLDALGVALEVDGALAIAKRAASPALAGEFARLHAALPAELPCGYVSEVCGLLGPWIASLAASLERGVIMLFDYGLTRSEYYHPQRSSGTMRCHFRHHAHEDPLLYPGLQDITAWVDFTRIAEAAVDAGVEVQGYCTQAAFLLANGIEAQVAAAPSAPVRARLAAEARQLLLPGEMGENFKLMTLSRDAPEELEAFAYQDLRRLL